MKNTKRLISLFVIAVILFGCLSVGFTASAANYPLLISKDYQLEVTSGEVAEIIYNYYPEFENEQIDVTIYDSYGNAIAESSKQFYNTSYKTEYTITWDTTGIEPGEYKVVAKKHFYSLYRWNTAPSDTVSYITINAPKTSTKSLKTPNASVSNITDGVYVQWKEISGAGQYYVYRRTGTSGSWKKVKTTRDTFYLDKNTRAGKTYYYRVRAINGDIKSGVKTSAAICRLKNPSSVKLTKAAKGFKVTWSKVTGAKKYEIYRRTGTGKWSKIKTTSSTKYVDKSAKKGKYYTYRVRAVKGDSKSIFKTSSKKKR